MFQILKLGFKEALVLLLYINFILLRHVDLFFLFGRHEESTMVNAIGIVALEMETVDYLVEGQTGGDFEGVVLIKFIVGEIKMNKFGVRSGKDGAKGSSALGVGAQFVEGEVEDLEYSVLVEALEDLCTATEGDLVVMHIELLKYGILSRFEIYFSQDLSESFHAGVLNFIMGNVEDPEGSVGMERVKQDGKTLVLEMVSF